MRLTPFPGDEEITQEQQAEILSLASDIHDTLSDREEDIYELRMKFEEILGEEHTQTWTVIGAAIMLILYGAEQLTVDDKRIPVTVSAISAVMMVMAANPIKVN